MATAKNALVAARLAPLRAELTATRDAILQDLAPHHERRDSLIVQIQPLEHTLRELQQVIKAKEAPLRETLNALAQIDRAIGAKSMPLAGGETAAAAGEVG